MVLVRLHEAGLPAPCPRECLGSVCCLRMLVSSQAEEDYRECFQSASEQCAHKLYHVPPPARECSALCFLSAFKGCFLEAEPMAVLTSPWHFHTFRLPPSNSFFWGEGGWTENLLKANHFQYHAGFGFCCCCFYLPRGTVNRCSWPTECCPAWGPRRAFPHNPCPNLAG